MVGFLLCTSPGEGVVGELNGKVFERETFISLYSCPQHPGYVKRPKLLSSGVVDDQVEDRGQEQELGIQGHRESLVWGRRYLS